MVFDVNFIKKKSRNNKRKPVLNKQAIRKWNTTVDEYFVGLFRNTINIKYSMILRTSFKPFTKNWAFDLGNQRLFLEHCLQVMQKNTPLKIELSSCSNCTNYHSMDLKITTETGEYVHVLLSTIPDLTNIMCAFLGE